MGTWTVGPRAANWVTNPTIGDGTTPNGGVPPGLAYELAPIDEVGYTRADWLGTDVNRIDITGDTSVIGGGKFRVTLQHLKFGGFDPIVMPGVRGMKHLHEFFGNIAVNENSTWQSLRESPGSNNVGGPLNASPYWTPAQLFLDPETGLWLPVKSLYHQLYYNLQTLADPAETFRLPRGIKIIGGVNPADRFNTARLAEIPTGIVKEIWSGTPGASVMSGRNRYNGFLGWNIFHPVTGNIAVAPGSDADINPESGFPRQLVNSDGSDPWDGAAEDPDCIMVALIMQPVWWDGQNLESPNGRDHLRYQGYVEGNGNPMASIGPDGWWEFPHVENKGNYPNFRNGLAGHAYRERLWFSSDIWNMAGDEWPVRQPNCSTPHFDLIPAWDDEILTGAGGWQQQCAGITINGVAGDAGECDSGTISAVANLKYGARPPGYDDTMSPNPILSISDVAPAETKLACGIPVLNDRIPTAVSTC